MNFMIKTQWGHLIQVTDFTKENTDSGPCVVCYEKEDPDNGWQISYQTEQRRDEVFELLEAWIKDMIKANLFGQSAAYHEDFNISLIYPYMPVIFEFPKE